MTVLGVIPARGGSRGVPGKHLRVAGGRPLLAFTAEAALASRRLSRVIVSTDDTGIAEAARRLGLEVPFIRPAALATDEAPMLPVLQHAARHVAGAGAPADVLVLLQPTSPLRTAAHVDAAIALLEATGADSVVSVMEVPHRFNPVSVLRMDGERVVPFLEGPAASRRQDKPRVLARNGPAVLAVRTAVVEAGALYGDDCRPLLMDAEASLDIDTTDDFDLLDFYLTRRE